MVAYQSRAEIPEQYKWDIGVVYKNDAEWESVFAGVPALLDALRAFDGRLGEGAGVVRDALLAHEQASRVVDKLWQYTARHRDEDMSGSHYNAMFDRANGLYGKLEEAAAFLRPQLLALSISLGELPDYAHYLEDIQRDRAHTLSQAEEAILAQAGDLAGTPRAVHSMLTDADLSFEPIKDENAEEVAISTAAYQRYTRSGDRRVRRDAHTSFLSAYKQHRNSLAATFAGNIKKNVFFARARRYESALHASLHPANIDPAVYHNLIEGVHSGLPLLHRYYRLRKRVLGVEKLRFYDLNAPLEATYPNKTRPGTEKQKRISYEQAVELVLGAMEALGQQYADGARQVFRSRWIDVYETPGKRAGAHSGGCYDSPPYTMLNYLDTLQGVYTLAHEMGHALHTLYSNSAQPYHYAYYNDFVSEIASTLNENLLTHYLLGQSDDPAMRFTLVNMQVNNLRHALFRQTMLSEFELAACSAYEQGEALSADWLGDTYMALNRQYAGDEVDLDDLVRVEWSFLPHLYVDKGFFVYQYATGAAAANALAHAILTQGKEAAARYRQFLSRGNSAYTLDLLKDAGVDMGTTKPVEDTLTVFENRLDELEILLQ